MQPAYSNGASAGTAPPPQAVPEPLPQSVPEPPPQAVPEPVAQPAPEAAPSQPAPVIAAAPEQPAPDGKTAYSDPLVSTLDELVGLLASRLGKEVRLDARGFDTTSLDEARRRVVMDVLAQLTRNSIAHGIEPANVREAAGKARLATITVRDTGSTPADFRFSYRDDGSGLDPDRIRRAGRGTGSAQ